MTIETLSAVTHVKEIAAPSSSAPVTVRALDPLTDPAWPDFVHTHPDSSIFHTRAWLRALHLSYGYTPVVFTTSPPGNLSNAVVCCEIASPLTGRRLVSLPFSDHCEPLAHGRDLAAILIHLAERRDRKRWRYVELRPVTSAVPEASASATSYHLHTVDLRAPLPEIYGRLHGSCVKRKLKRAERESLVYECGRSDRLLKQFRSLLLLTRRRHGIPPQPAHWFDNIVRCLGNDVAFHVVSKNRHPIASIVTLSHKRTLTYKYGCSDLAASNLGGTPLLFWTVMRQAHKDGFETFDLGRSDPDDDGLIAFKEHLGATPAKLTYWRSPMPHNRGRQAGSASAKARAWAQRTLVGLPDSLFSGVGDLLYRHIG